MDRKRIFGSGPTCFIVGIVLVLIAYFLGLFFEFPMIKISDYFSSLIFIISIVLTLLIVFWGFLSLPLSKRGKSLVVDKAFRYFRHPIYAGFVDFFVFGLGFYLKSFSILVSGVILIFIFGRIVDKEEKYLVEQFGQKYRDYRKTTKKFIPCVY